MREKERERPWRGPNASGVASSPLARSRNIPRKAIVIGEEGGGKPGEPERGRERGGMRGVTTPHTSDSLNGPTSLRSLAFEPSEASWAMQCAEAETATPVVVLLAEGRRTAGGERESKQGGRRTLACSSWVSWTTAVSNSEPSCRFKLRHSKGGGGTEARRRGHSTGDQSRRRPRHLFDSCGRRLTH